MSEGRRRHQRGIEQRRRAAEVRAQVAQHYVDLVLTLEYGAYGPRSSAEPGAEWRASYYDRALNKWPAGSGSTPWEAIAWAIVGMIASRAGHVIHAIDGTDTPASYLAKLEAKIGARP